MTAARDELGCDFFDWLSAVDELDAGLTGGGPPVVDGAAARGAACAPGCRATPPRRSIVVDVYPGAAWHERETHEMFGIDFPGHPDLAPLLLPPEFEGHPLRKDFVLATRVAKPWPGAKEPGESAREGTAKRQPMRPPGVPAPGEWGPRASAGGAGRRGHGRPRRGGLMPVWLELTIRVAGVVVAFLTLPLIVGQTEHKVMAHMQGRLGPMYAGAFHGWAQLIADGVKFVQKESVTPAAADGPVFRLAPFVALLPYLVVLLVIPLGPGGLVAQPLDIGLFFVLAVVGVGVVAGADGRRGPRRTSTPCSAACGRRPSCSGTSCRSCSPRRSVAMAAGHALAVRHRRGVAAVVAAVAAAGAGGLLRRRAGRDPPAAVRHADRRLGAGLRLHDRVHRPAVRVLPARRVRRASW